MVLSHRTRSVDIINTHTREDRGPDVMRDQIIAGLSKPQGQKSLPTMLLYDTRGLRIYDKITTDTTEYYLFAAEESILKKHADSIVRVMHSAQGDAAGKRDEVVVELGAGALRKTSHILQALSRLVPATMDKAPITYYALDLEESELERTLGELSESHVGSEVQGKVGMKGICGTYDDGLKFIQEGGLEGRVGLDDMTAEISERYRLGKGVRDTSPSSTSSSRTRTTETETDATPPSTPPAEHQPLHIMFLGTSLGNFARGEDATFLRSLPLRPGSSDTLLLGLDHDNGREKIEAAYNDSKGITREFIMNGLRCAGRALGNEHLFDQSKWEYVNTYNEKLRRHEAYYRSTCDQSVIDPITHDEYTFITDEIVRIEVSHKFSDQDAYTLFTEAGLRLVQRWQDDSLQYSLWLLERPQIMFPLVYPPKRDDEAENMKALSSFTPFGMPSVQEWQDMWAAWDYITLRMIPPSMLFQKPIDLRHICLFYCGHIPTFLSIHLSKMLGEPDTEPVEFKYIFERGIDPNVDDPTKCHPHSEVPLCDEDWPSLASILTFQSKVRQRVLKLYRDIEEGSVILTRKMARVLFMTLEHEAFHAETLLYMLLQRAGTGTIPPTGFNPPVWSSLVESWKQIPQPKTATVTLGPASITLGHDDDEEEDESTDVQGHQFGWDNEHPKREIQVRKFKIEWRPITNGEFYEFFFPAANRGRRGDVQFPASWVEIDGDILVRTLYGPVPVKTAWDWPIITSYDNLSTYASVKGGRIPTEPELRLFFDKFECGFEGGANFGFRNWYPIPATTGQEKAGGRGHNGGVWEWTSTVFEKHEGFVPSKLYPRYSTDFFDGHHQVVIGGSYATIPRLASRRTLVNYYQHNYPYAWVGARVAYDV